MPPTRCIRAISSAVTDNTQGAWILPRKAEHLYTWKAAMGKLHNIRTKLKRYRKECVSAWRLFGPKLAMEGYLAHTVGIGVDRYYTDLSQATWSTLMEDLPYSMSIPAVDEQQCANAPIWVMWWQGVDNQAPDIIQACVRSIRKHANGHPVHVISKQNLHEYASIDESVVQAAECGEIPMAVLSDIIRCTLLYQHGGAWIDATVYLTDDINPEVFTHPIYSIPVHQKNPTRNWTSYFIASTQGNPLFDYAGRSLTHLVTRGKGIPEYFMLDVMLSVAYTRHAEFTAMIDAIPANNEGRFAQSEQMDSTEAQPRIPSSTYINKLTYQIDYPTTVNGKETIYQRLLDGEF